MVTAKTVKVPPILTWARPIPLVITFAVAVVIWMIPPPDGVDQRAWHLLAIFVATIVGIIAKPLPMGAVAILGIAACATTETLSITEALSGFGNRVIWLVVAAFFISRGFNKTGLGARVAYLFMGLLGKRTLGLAYGMCATDLILGPAIPSDTARAGGVILPLVESVSKAYGSDPKDGTERRVGSFLVYSAFQGTLISSAMFLTAMAANPLAVEIAHSQGVNISWGMWALAACVPAMISFFAIPFLIYKVYPPEVKKTPLAAQMAKEKLAEMGSIKPAEWLMLLAFVVLLVLWIAGPSFGMHSTTAAIIGLAFLLMTGVLSWDDILDETGAWNTLVWFAALVMMAGYMNELGLIPWFGKTVGQAVHGIGWMQAFLALSLVYFYVHYFFASSTAHVSAMYGAFLAVAIAVGTPPMLAALVLAFFNNLFASTTHYGTGPAPVLFGTGYVAMGAWWKVGFLISVVNIFIWIVLGGMWWKFLGLW
jgi:divalent anion:Na+ symporter, DASS family